MITIDTVSKRYVSSSGTVEIGPVSVQIPPGGVTALVGPNGAGKSTLLTMVGRLLGIDEGAIEVAGVHQRTLEGIQSNFLLLGIIIGLIARGSLMAVPFVAFGIAVLEVGAGSMQRVSGAPVEVVLILEGLILLFILMSDVVVSRMRHTRAKATT